MIAGDNIKTFMTENRSEKKYFSGGMSDYLFRLFSELIYNQCGIKMPSVKKVMLTSRLQKRVNALGMDSFSDYYSYISSSSGKTDELNKMIDVITTNKTEFFRESHHFNYLIKEVLPELTNSGRRSIDIWSAGCSTGEEAYSIAMSLAYSLDAEAKHSFRILGTDISTRVLEKAARAVYTEDVIAPIPLQMKKNFLLRGKGEQEGLFKVAPEIRRRVEFRRLNFMDEKYDLKKTFDIIFCRNVVIYFDKETQRELFAKLYDHLSQDGYLFIGHAESLQGINSRFRVAAPTVYRKI